MSTSIVSIMNRNPHIENRSSSFRHFRSPTKNNRTPRNIRFAMKTIDLSIGIVAVPPFCVCGNADSGSSGCPKGAAAMCNAYS